MTARLSTRFTELVGIRLPIVQAGMSWVSSCAELPLAVSEAGGLGVVAAGPMRLPDLRRVLDAVATGTRQPWAVNLPLYRPEVDQAIRLLLDAAPPVLIASQGGPRRYLADFKSVGTICVQVVASVAHARKAIDAGVDALVVVGGEAGGHPPESQVSSLVLTRLLARDAAEVPLVAAGGFADGAGLAAALALGADAVQFGTRFIASAEARIHPAYRAAVVHAAAEDTELVGRGLGPVRVLRNRFAEEMLELERTGAPLAERRRRFDAGPLRAAAQDGAVDDAKVEAGQSAGLIDGVEPAADIVLRIAEDCAEVMRRLTTLVQHPAPAP